MAGPDGSISIDHGSIEAQARNLGDLKNELENAVQTTTGQIQSLYESGAFKGLSGSSFHEIFTRWNKEAGDLFAVILFTRLQLTQDVADRFRTIALDIKSSLFFFDEESVFSAPAGQGALPPVRGD